MGEKFKTATDVDARSLDEVLNFRGLMPEHQNWMDYRKKSNFLRSITNFYFNDFIPDKESNLKNVEVGHFIYVDKNFVGFGRMGDKILDILPYNSEKEFIKMIEKLKDEAPIMGVFISISQHTLKLEEMIVNAKKHLGIWYENGFLMSEGPYTVH